MDEGRGQLPAAEAVGDRAVARLAGEPSLDLRVIPALRVPHVHEREIVLIGPEEGDGVETLPPAEDVSCRGLPLTLRHDPVLHANALTGVRIGPAGDVAGGEDAWDARLEVLVHSHAAVDGESRLLGERDRRPDPDADDDEIRRYLVPVLQCDRTRIDRGGNGPEMEGHTVLFVE